MCKFSYANFGKEYKCDVSKTLKIPKDSKGFCIFHSNDIKWKRDNNCINYFLAFLQNRNDDDSKKVNVYGFHITGHKLKDLKQSHYHYDTFSLNEFIFTKVIYFEESTFYDDVHLQRGWFKEMMTFSNCIFKGNVEIDKIRFGGELIISSCSFESNFILISSSLGNTLIDSSNFFEMVDFRYNQHHSVTTFIENNFEPDFFLNLSGDYRSKLHITGNKELQNLKFYDAIFSEEVIVQDILSDCNLSITHTKIRNKFLIQGNVKKIGIGPESIIEIKKEDFENNGRIIFDFCNILNLTNTFLENVQELEKLEKIKINDTCKTNRFKYTITYKSRDINKDLFEDFSNIITRFFNEYYTLDLNVTFLRRKNEPFLDVIYSTNQFLKKDFFEMIKELFEKINSNLNYFSKDLQLQINHYIERCILKSKVGLLEEDEQNEILTLDNNIIFMNIKQTIKGNNNITNLLSDSSNSTINVRNEKSYLKAKEDIKSSKALNDAQIKQAIEIIEDIVDRFEKKEEIKPYLKDSLLSIVGNMSSVVSFINTLIPFS